MTENEKFDTGAQHWWIAMLRGRQQNESQHGAGRHVDVTKRRQQEMLKDWEKGIQDYRGPHSARATVKGVSFPKEATPSEDMEERSDDDAFAIVRNLSRYSNDGGFSTKLQSYTRVAARH